VFSLPDRADLMPEALALAAETATGVLTRFAEYTRGVRAVQFDRSEPGLTDGRHAGVAEPGLQLVHLNIALVAFHADLELRRQLAARSLDQPHLTPPLRPAPPFTAVDGTVAHEIWHVVEAAFEARRYRESMEFRRDLGHYFEPRRLST
jgi:hypothetical protein